MKTLTSTQGTVEWYLDVKRAVIDAGYATEADWAQYMEPCGNADAFWREFAWVVLNSGMKEQIARQIWNRVRPAVESGGSARDVFGHAGKAEAIDGVFKHRYRLFQEYCATPDDLKVEWCDGLPWIGGITKWHLAKNLGVDCAKPDRHLVRLAGAEGTHAMCKRLSDATGDRVATVDVVIWRAANLGII